MIYGKGRKVLQWQLWTFCDGNCDFCMLGKQTKVYDKQRMLTSLDDLHKTVCTLDYTEYGTIALIGGEFFQGQLYDPELKEKFFFVLRNILLHLKNHELDAVWITASLTSEHQTELYELLDLAKEIGIERGEGEHEGLWICTSYDTEGRFDRFHTESSWVSNMERIYNSYPFVKLNTTMILTQPLIDYYLKGTFKPKEFCERHHTSIFYMNPYIECDWGVLLNSDDSLFKGMSYAKFYWVMKQRMQHKMKLFPTRESFIKFLRKYKEQDSDTWDKLFNIQYRSDEIHINSEKLEHDYVSIRNKDGSGNETDMYPTLPCGHTYTFSCYIDSEKCCLCDKLALE